MALSSDDFRNLTIELRDLARVVQNQTDATRGERRSGGPSGGGGSGAAFGSLVNGPVGGGAGFALSAARQVLGSAGGPIAGAASSVLGGLASGGLVGGAVAGAGAALNLGMQFQRAGQQGALNAPVFAGEGRVRYEEQFAKQTQANSWRQSLDAFNQFNPFAHLLGSDMNAGVRRQRELNRERAYGADIADATTAEVGAFVGPIEGAGGHVSKKVLGDLVAHVGRQKMAQAFALERTQKMADTLLLPSIEAANRGVAR